MTLAVTHTTVTGAAADTTALVDGPAWDAAHTLTGAASPAQGGTGVANNAASTITITGSFGATFTLTATTSLTFPTTGTLATLAGSEELTNKTLTTAVAKGTWTASGTWTLPDFTLGGTVSGGGNQINNVIIGAATPLAGSFTSVGATSATITNNSANSFSVAGSSSNSIGFNVTNTVASGHVWGFYSSGGGPSPLGSFVFYDSTAGGPRMILGTDGAVTLNSTTVASSPTTGSIITGGGIGVAGAGYFGAAVLSTSATAGVGYSAGAGGTITQATSKATGVALNKVCGAITMNNAALAAATIVSFVLTDSAIAVTDVLVLNHISGGTIGSYTLNAQAAAGSATINVRNNTAGSLSEAIVIQFAVVKGVNA